MTRPAQFMTLQAARENAHRAFCRGLIVGGIAMACGIILAVVT